MNEIANLDTYRARKLLTGCRNGLHQPLTDETRDSILAFLDDPTEANWDRIYGKVIDSVRTIWIAVIDGSGFTGTKTSTGWTETPAGTAVAAAIRAAVEEPAPAWDTDLLELV